MKTVSLKTEKGVISGIVSHNHTGNEKNKIIVEFTYEGRNYQFPFSRKTGKLYDCKLPFQIMLIVDETTKTLNAW